MFQPSLHMLPLTWRCNDAPVQLVDVGDPLTPAATQTALIQEGGEKYCGEELMVMKEVKVSTWVICPDIAPSYHGEGHDLSPHAVH